MKILVLVPLLFVTISVSAQLDRFTMPAEWAADFTISLSYTGSMSGGSTHLRLTHDSCEYISASGREAPKKKRFHLSDADRVTILKKMNELRVDKIRPEHSLSVVNDGWSSSICFGVHCIEGGTSAKMSEEDKNVFLSAYGYLEEFAVNKKVEK